MKNGLATEDAQILGNPKRAKRKMSAAHRAAIIAAQKARWAKVKGASSELKEKTAKRNGGMSAAGRAKIAAAQKARWAKVRAEKK